jgi:hypothetical protein
LLGGALPWLFGSLAMRAVTRAASQIVEEVRNQFRIPGLMEGKVKPDYARVVSISTGSSQKELIPLATISIVVPLLVGLILGVEALGGFLAGVILNGQLLAVFMANSGGAWDNAKKSIEDEPSDPERNTGKGSERHKASVVGDTVGDPLKDTVGPALNPMIKVVNLVSLLAAPILVQSSLFCYLPRTTRIYDDFIANRQPDQCFGTGHAPARGGRGFYQRSAHRRCRAGCHGAGLPALRREAARLPATHQQPGCSIDFFPH